MEAAHTSKMFYLMVFTPNSSNMDITDYPNILAVMDAANAACVDYPDKVVIVTAEIGYYPPLDAMGKPMTVKTNAA